MRKIVWSEQARADVRLLDRQTAMRIFASLQRFAETGKGDMRKLRARAVNCVFALGITACGSLMMPMAAFAFTPSATAKKHTDEA